MYGLAVYGVPVLGAVGLAFSAYRYWWVVDQEAGNDQMKEIGLRIQRGAMSIGARPPGSSPPATGTRWRRRKTPRSRARRQDEARGVEVEEAGA